MHTHCVRFVDSHVCMKLSVVCMYWVCICVIGQLFMYRGYEMLSKAMELGNLKAKRRMAYANLVSTVSNSNVTFFTNHVCV